VQTAGKAFDADVGAIEPMLIDHILVHAHEVAFQLQLRLDERTVRKPRPMASQ
jgi:hypothetical protein